MRAAQRGKMHSAAVGTPKRNQELNRVDVERAGNLKIEVLLEYRAGGRAGSWRAPRCVTD